MTFDHVDRFFVLFSGGVGMALAGGVNVLLGRLSVVSRLVLTVAGCGVALGGIMLYMSDPVLIAMAATVMAVGVLPVLLASSTTLVGLVRRAVALALRPGVRWGLLTAVGVFTVAGSVALFEMEDEARTDQGMREMGLENDRPPLIDTDSAIARTDRGTPVPAKQPAARRAETRIGEAERRFLQSSPFSDQLMRRREAGDSSNCHGWVFTGGRFWLDAATVELIIADNGYVDVTAPRPGDLAIYRHNGLLSHTGVVRYVSEGAPVLVEGKWGVMGVYVHPADHSPYGTPTFYRSARAGHLLSGLDDIPSAKY